MAGALWVVTARHNALCSTTRGASAPRMRGICVPDGGAAGWSWRKIACRERKGLDSNRTTAYTSTRRRTFVQDQCSCAPYRRSRQIAFQAHIDAPDPEHHRIDDGCVGRMNYDRPHTSLSVLQF